MAAFKPLGFMSLKNEKALIVSAWGRGAYLAYNLAKAGVRTEFLDCSSRLPLSPAEREGPLPLFTSFDFSPLQRQFLGLDTEYSFALRQGFSYFDSEGPFSTHDSVKPFSPNLREKKVQQADELINFLKNNVLDSLTKNNAVKPGDYFLRQRPLSWFKDIGEKLKKAGVCFLEEQLTEEVLKNNVIWTLSSLETLKLFPQFMDTLFPDWKEPAYLWKRFLLKWEPGVFTNILPRFFVVLPQKFSINKEQALKDIFIIQLNPFSANADLWRMIPFMDVKKDLSCYAEGMKKTLTALFPFEGILVEPIAGVYQQYFAVYQSAFLKKTRKTSSSIWPFNPEFLGRLDPASFIPHSDKIYKALVL